MLLPRPLLLLVLVLGTAFADQRAAMNEVLRNAEVRGFARACMTEAWAHRRSVFPLSDRAAV